MVIDSDVRICGLKIPFFPMRPSMGRRITPSNVGDFAPTSVEGYAIQPKLNGDRAILAITESNDVVITNRYGSWFKHPVLNRDVYRMLGSGTILDGEVRERNFYPFEAIAIAGQPFLKRCPSVRIEQAKCVCFGLGVDWLFETPDESWIRDQVAQFYDDPNPMWEGLVFKKLGSSYVPLGSSSMDSPTWRKSKWSRG